MPAHIAKTVALLGLVVAAACGPKPLPSPAPPEPNEPEVTAPEGPGERAPESAVRRPPSVRLAITHAPLGSGGLTDAHPRQAAR